MSARSLIHRSAIEANQFLLPFGWNLVAECLPAIYTLLSRFWMAQIDPHGVNVAASFDYVGTVFEIVNEGFPRASGYLYSKTSARDQLPSASKQQSMATLLWMQFATATLLAVITLCCISQFSDITIGTEVSTSETNAYLAVSIINQYLGCFIFAANQILRALDHTKIAALATVIKTLVNVILDLIFISNLSILAEPRLLDQAFTALGVTIAHLLAMIGFVWFFWSYKAKSSKIKNEGSSTDDGLMTSYKFNTSHAKQIVKIGWAPLLEVIIRNVSYLWLVSLIVDLGPVYGGAWGVFNTIRWSLIMTPCYALGDTCGLVSGRIAGRTGAYLSLEYTEDLKIAWFTTTLFGLAVVAYEMILYLGLGFSTGLAQFASLLTDDPRVVDLAVQMWTSIDPTYWCFAMSTAWGSAMLAMDPRLILPGGFIVPLLWQIPIAFAMRNQATTPDEAWTYNAYIFGGSNIVNFLIAIAVIYADHLLIRKKSTQVNVQELESLVASVAKMEEES